MYQVLYRKYRPKTFSDVIGQPQVTTTLKNELESGRIAHAYLFTGTRGTGKTTCAKILAKAVNCLNPQNGDPCGECEICKGLDDGSIMDVVEIDAASNNGVDSIRALIEEAAFTPANTKYRVYIIDEVHMLSASAFNALLKTLEEPPAHVIFILATTEVHKLLPTILSRCQRFDFRRISPEDIADRLEFVAAQEDSEINRDAALLIARIADGGMRDALSIFDQCLGKNKLVDIQIVRETAGVSDRSYLLTLATAISEKNSADAIYTINELYTASKDMSRLCEEMAEYFRAVMIIKTTKKPSSVLLLTQQELDEMTPLALKMPLPMVINALSSFEDCLNRIRFGNARTEVEMTFVRLCSPELDSTLESLIQRIEQLESRPQASHASQTETVLQGSNLFGGLNNQNTAVKPAISEQSSEPQTKSSSKKLSIEELSASAKPFDKWTDILKLVKSYSASVAAAFEGSSAYLSGDYLLIDAPQFAFELLKRPSQRDRIRDSVKQVMGKAYKLGPYKKPNGEGSAETDPLEELEQRAKDAGLI